MQAITTKYLPATNFRGSRIKAVCAGGSVTVPYDYGSYNPHQSAARALVEKMGWDSSTAMIEGVNHDGQNVFVFVQAEGGK